MGNSLTKSLDNIMARNKPVTKIKQPEIVVVTSGKGGVGKTFLSVNLALLWQKLGKKVLLIDADFHLGNADLILGITTERTIADVILNKVDLADVITAGPGGIDLLPASSGETKLLEQQDYVLRDLARAFEQFVHDYDLIVVDTGSGIGRDVLSFILVADKVLLTVTPDPAAITDAYAVIKVLKQTDSTVPVLLVANSTESEEEGAMLYNKMNLIVGKFLNDSIRYGGTVMASHYIRDSIRHREPLVLHHPRSNTIRELNIVIKNLENTPFSQPDRTQNIFNRIKQNRKESPESGV